MTEPHWAIDADINQTFTFVLHAMSKHPVRQCYPVGGDYSIGKANSVDFNAERASCVQRDVRRSIAQTRNLKVDACIC